MSEITFKKIPPHGNVTMHHPDGVYLNQKLRGDRKQAIVVGSLPWSPKELSDEIGRQFGGDWDIVDAFVMPCADEQFYSLVTARLFLCFVFAKREADGSERRLWLDEKARMDEVLGLGAMVKALNSRGPAGPKAPAAPVSPPVSGVDPDVLKRPVFFKVREPVPIVPGDEKTAAPIRITTAGPEMFLNLHPDGTLHLRDGKIDGGSSDRAA